MAWLTFVSVLGKDAMIVKVKLKRISGSGCSFSLIYLVVFVCLNLVWNILCKIWHVKVLFERVRLRRKPIHESYFLIRAAKRMWTRFSLSFGMAKRFSYISVFQSWKYYWLFLTINSLKLIMWTANQIYKRCDVYNPFKIYK